jgi:hypothetical protein
MTISSAPIADRLLDDTGKCRPTWVEFFSDLTRGDIGTTWNPTINNLTSVGTPTITGVYYQNQGFTDFAVKIVPGTDTSSTLGSTTIVLPFNVVSDVPVHVVTGQTTAAGVITASSKTVFLPTWTAITSPLTITGRVKN